MDLVLQEKYLVNRIHIHKVCNDRRSNLQMQSLDECSAKDIECM